MQNNHRSELQKKVENRVIRALEEEIFPGVDFFYPKADLFYFMNRLDTLAKPGKAKS